VAPVVVIHMRRKGNLTYIPGSTVMTMFGASRTSLSYGMEVSWSGKGDFFRCMSCMVAVSARSR
jgi:hypothetical protein